MEVLAAAVQAAVPAVEQAVPAVEQAVLAVEALTAESAAPAPPTLLNLPVVKAVRVAIPRPNLPAARARIASIPQGRELGRGAPVPA